MNRTASKLGIGALLTFGLFATAAAQATKPTKKTTTPTVSVPVTKEAAPTTVVVHDTVYVTRHDTTTVFRRDTLRVAGRTVMRRDTVTVVQTPGWLDRSKGAYFGVGAGSYYPSGGLGGGQIPGYAFQMNLGVDPVGSPLGIRLTGGLARPDEAQVAAALGGRPSVVNLTGDLKLRLPFFNGSKYPMFGLYAVGGGALSMFKDLRQEDQAHTVVLQDRAWHHGFGYDLGGGGSLQIGHSRELFLEARMINFKDNNYESNHQLPLILGVNWH